MGNLTPLLARMKGRHVYLDTNIFIYFLDRNPIFFSGASLFIEAAVSGDIIAHTGDITIAETLVKPYQTDNINMVDNFKAFFTTPDLFSIESHDAGTFELAAELRAKRGMKFVDALHYATALRADCQFFVTNDNGIASSEGMEVISISDFTG